MSPDGSRVIWQDPLGGGGLNVFDRASGTSTPLGDHGGGTSIDPAGVQVAVPAFVDGTAGLWVAPLDGSAGQFFGDQPAPGALDWDVLDGSPTLLTTTSDGIEAVDLATGARTPFLDMPVTDEFASADVEIAPDGSLVAHRVGSGSDHTLFLVDASGQVVQQFPGVELDVVVHPGQRRRCLHGRILLRDR